MTSISLMSAPAAKTRSPPYRITARTSLRSVASRAHSSSSARSWLLMAFILGRSSRMVPTAPSTSSRTNSPTIGPPGSGVPPSLASVFRDSRGVVHTVSATDPLTDVPAAAATALATALLVPVDDDLGSALERCEAVIALLERWQDEFLAALPPEFDAEEERGYAEAAGLDYDDLHD